MNKYIKVLSVVLALSSSVYLPHANAASTNSSTGMLITLAETDPVLVERLNDIALNDPILLNQLLKLADSNVAQLERLLNLLENDPVVFEQLVTIKSAEVTKVTKAELGLSDYSQAVTFGTIDDGGVIQN